NTNKGRHVTSYRQLIILNNGAIIIDNPGIREVGIADAARGLEITFNMIKNLAVDCRFKNCSHTREVGCAVLEAVEKGEIKRDTYENYLKMERESIHFEATIAEKRKKDKEFGKSIKNYKKNLDKKNTKPPSLFAFRFGMDHKIDRLPSRSLQK
ncbi:MAG TPA: hypothetical protein VLN46_00850, partial [Gillisia sp.]|nr:hypothetical protein [Gillisia sp.]